MNRRAIRSSRPFRLPPPLRLGLLLAILLGSAAAVPGAASTLESTPRRLTSGRGVAIEAMAGMLRVPERRGAATGRTIEVTYLHLKSRAAAPRAPLFYLAGGPGNHGVSDQPRSLDFWSPFLDVSDVVLIDQRGVNDSSLTWSWDGPLPMSYFVHADSARRHVEAMSRRALEVFRRRGVDLAGYTTRESAADLDELRAALGFERVSLLAFSYGTHLAAAYLREHGDRVENAVLIGTEGPDHTMKLPWAMDVQFRRLAAFAAGDPRIAGRVPDLGALYDRVIARLAREPMVVNLEGPEGEALPLPIGPFGLRLFLRADIGDATDLVVFPRLLWSIDQGDPTVLAWFANKRAGTVLGVHGMNLAMDAASGASAGRRAVIAEQAATSRFGDLVNFPHPTATAAWGLPVLPDSFRAPLVSAVRTLFVSGELDWNAPPYQAEELRWGMTNATHLVVAHAGHEQTFFQNATASPVVVDFLAGKDVSERRISYPALRFVPLEGMDAEASHPSVSR